ncbi:Class II abasic (AP) endonuclease [Rhodotorula toruloides]
MAPTSSVFKSDAHGAETKLKKEDVTSSMANLNKFDSFFSCAGWSQHGTASFTRRSLVVPVKAEEGLTYNRAFKSAGFKAIGGYRTGPDLKHQRKVDSEGRLLALDCGLFILLNVYFPFEGIGVEEDAEKLKEKAERKETFKTLLDAYISAQTVAGRSLIIVGDFNLAASEIDTWCPEARAKSEGRAKLMDHPGRAWLAELTGENGKLVDVFRRKHPGERVYTWFESSENRHVNRGSRVDFTLVSPALLPWVKDCSILDNARGSDHLPAVLELHSEIDTPDGHKLLCSEINGGRSSTDPPAKPPSFAAKNWEQFSRRDIRGFFTRAPTKGRVDIDLSRDIDDEDDA